MFLDIRSVNTFFLYILTHVEKWMKFFIRLQYFTYSIDAQLSESA